jgi:hypothetical protein
MFWNTKRKSGATRHLMKIQDGRNFGGQPTWRLFRELPRDGKFHRRMFALPVQAWIRKKLLPRNNTF